MKPSTEIKIVSILFTLLLTAFCLAIFSYRSNNKIKDNNSLVLHTNKLLYKSEKLLSLLSKSRRSTVDYVKNGDIAFLKIFEQSKDSVFANIKELKKLTSGNATHQLKMDTIISFVNKKMNVYKQLQYLKSGNHYFEDSATALIDTDKKISENLRTVVYSIQNEEDSLLTIREKKIHKDEDASGISFIAFVWEFIVFNCYNILCN